MSLLEIVKAIGDLSNASVLSILIVLVLVMLLAFWRILGMLLQDSPTKKNVADALVTHTKEMALSRESQDRMLAQFADESAWLRNMVNSKLEEESAMHRIETQARRIVENIEDIRTEILKISRDEAHRK